MLWANEIFDQKTPDTFSYNLKNEKLKIATIVGTRPEIIRLSMVIKKLVETTEHTLIHTGQNYDFELNEIFLRIWESKHQIII